MRETSGESMRTNMALLEHNAVIAAQIAVALMEG
jgi:pseudouridine-5'-phosphate glycosidase